jgi:hypothetical protein
MVTPTRVATSELRQAGLHIAKLVSGLEAMPSVTPRGGGGLEVRMGFCAVMSRGRWHRCRKPARIVGAVNLEPPSVCAERLAEAEIVEHRSNVEQFRIEAQAAVTARQAPELYTRQE